LTSTTSILQTVIISPIRIPGAPSLRSGEGQGGEFNWSVLMKEDGFGFGYVSQLSSENNVAMREGWVLISADLTLAEACQMRDDLRSGEVIIEDLAV
jgi:hypothetical protein